MGECKSGIQNELKIAGTNLFLVSAGICGAVIVLAAAGGELLDLYPVSFEVIFPFFAAVSVGEWARTRADGNFDLIAAQSRSLFAWALKRSAAVFGTVSFFAVGCMAAVSLIRYAYPLRELIFMYFPPAFFLSSLAAWVGLESVQEHLAAAVSGLVWLAALLTRSLLRIRGVEYIYLFICYAGDPNHVWLWNKGIYTAAGILIWAAIFRRNYQKKVNRI